MSPRDNEALVRRLLDEAYNRRNLAVGDELLAADCVLHGTTAIHGKLELLRDDIPWNWPIRGYSARASEIAPLHEVLGSETLVVAGVEPAILADDESYNKLQGKQRQLWLDLFYEMGTERSIIDASRHLLYIGKKK
jgi:hypothetical protein